MLYRKKDILTIIRVAQTEQEPLSVNLEVLTMILSLSISLKRCVTIVPDLLIDWLELRMLRLDWWDPRNPG